MSTTVYIATAYRYGSLNGHWYLVDAGTDLEKVKENSRSECHCRGGKYGIEVIEFSEGPVEKRIAYFPSAYGEAEPKDNGRIALCDSFGSRLLMELEDRERDGREIPDWCAALLKTEREINAVMYPEKR